MREASPDGSRKVSLRYHDPLGSMPRETSRQGIRRAHAAGTDARLSPCSARGNRIKLTRNGFAIGGGDGIPLHVREPEGDGATIPWMMNPNRYAPETCVRRTARGGASPPSLDG